MPVCSFCKGQYKFPKGTTVIQKDGSVRYYCSSKCRKNSEMGRLAKKVKWIQKSDIACPRAKRKYTISEKSEAGIIKEEKAKRAVKKN